MKRLIKAIIVIVSAVLMSGIFSFSVLAEDSSVSDEEIRGQVNEMLEEYDISYSYDDMGELSLRGMLSSIKEAALTRIKAPMRLLGIILIIVIFISFMKNVGETAFPENSSANLYNLVCVLSAVAVVSPPLMELYENAADTLERGGGFMLVFVPVFAGITIMSGGITSGAIYNTVVLGAAEIMVQLAANIVMPVLTMTAALSISGSVFPNATLDSITQLMRKIITWGLTAAVTLFTGFVSLKSTLGSSVDGFATKTIKFLISGFVPIVGSAVSDAYATVRGSFDIMRCTAGTAGTIAVVLIMLPPILETAAFRIVMWTAKTAAEMFSVTPLEKLFKGLDAGLAIVMSVLICFSVLFVISTAILMKSTA
ncbi:MAG: hypothetical protein IJX77_10540 [Ruminococcus sp.]|nr:hypothetical protein [Ruminococcus sp.]